MPDVPASPTVARLATPSWLDARLVLGVLLVLVSVIVGARLLSSADASQGVWVLTRDLAAGSTLRSDDLKPGKVRLFDSGDRYLLASGDKPVGYVLQRGVGADELLPRDSLVRPDDRGRSLRDVSVPVGPGHLPDDLQAGQLVDIYVTPGQGGTGAGSTTAGSTTAGSTTAGSTTAPAATTRRVLSAVPVTLRPRAGGLGASGPSAVVLSVSDHDAAVLVAALQQGGVDLVRLPLGAELPALSSAATLAATPD